MFKYFSKFDSQKGINIFSPKEKKKVKKVVDTLCVIYNTKGIENYFFF